MSVKIRHAIMDREVLENPESQLPKSLRNAAFTKRQALAILMDFDRGIMNGLATHAETPDHDNLLIAEYARNRGILTLTDPVFGKFQVPGCETSDWNILIFLSLAAIRNVPELNDFFGERKTPSAILWESYASVILPWDPNDPLRREFSMIVATNFSRTASSPLKHDIVPALAEKGWVASSEEAGMVVPETVRPLSIAERAKLRKYRVWGEGGIHSSERYLRKHLSHYSNFFTLDAERPSEIHLTISGKSANTAVIRFVSSRISDHSKIDVHPGYFFLNELDFALEVPSSWSVDSQALFFSIDAGYAWMGWKNRYFEAVSEKIDRLIERAEANPETPYFVCADVTSDLSGFSDRLSELINACSSLPNLTALFSSSLTKYNRSERNYHFGIVARYGTDKNAAWLPSEGLPDFEKFVSTSYGDLSPRGILHFPRLRLSAVKRQRENAETNRKAFVNAFISAFSEPQAASFRFVRFEHYSAYSYLILDLPANVRNPAVSSFLQVAVPSELRGSSFYHNEIRFCDVPDVSCSRFAPAPGEFENAVRISWPDTVEETKMAELGKNLGQYLLGMLSY